MANGLDGRIVGAFTGGFNLDTHTVCAAYMGSTSHNTYVPKDDPDSIDDVDIMGVVAPPPSKTIGLLVWEHWTLQRDELDVVMYSLRKLVGLLLKSNPNVVGLLWLRPEHYILVHPAFEELRGNREVFSSKNAYSAFAGYASAQIQKMESLAFQGYMGAKRKALVERHGYDTKNAAHAIRLLRMGAEFLETGELKVSRDEDAEEIRSIKRGEWTLEQVRAEADRGFARAKEAHDRSSLPENPDFEKAETLLLDITFQLWRETGELVSHE
jgi:predicted nucleotidyltransferase